MMSCAPDWPMRGLIPRLPTADCSPGQRPMRPTLSEAASRGVFGAPFYITDTDQRFWGQDRIEDLDLHLAGKI